MSNKEISQSPKLGRREQLIQPSVRDQKMFSGHNTTITGGNFVIANNRYNYSGASSNRPLGSTLLQRNSDWNVEKGFTVSTRRLHPELDKLLLKSSSSMLTADIIHSKQTQLPSRLGNELRSHVFNNMPIRLLETSKMKLLSRNEVIEEIAHKMTAIDETLLSTMIAVVEELGKTRSTAPEYFDEQQDNDAREDPLKAVCHYLIVRYARYAILSHTWLLSGEIEYKDAVQDGWWKSHPGGPGYCKIKGLCEAANAHNTSLVWMDTLCINKDSSSELDESIRSMYKWYQDSYVCITYLSETSGIDDLHDDRWFRRGWTLQELLAPKTMKFYCQDWTHLSAATLSNSDSDKLNPTIQRHVSRITGITSDELLSFDPLTGSTVATRMSWAASRVTTRGEDRAYSLMGIFGVNFPTAYGEGSERAFFRLVEAIISSRPTSHVLDALNWSGKSISPTIHPSRLIPAAPDCYKPDAEKNSFTPYLSSPMLLTHLGLRVKLLFTYIASCTLIIVEADPPGNGPYHMNLNLLPCPESGFKETSVGLYKRFPSPPEDIAEVFNPTPQAGHTSKMTHILLFLGIYDFTEDEDENTLYTQNYILLPSSSYALILCIAKPSDRLFDIDKLLPKHIQPTSKIETRNLLRIRRSGSRATSSSRERIAESDLSTRGMKLLEVYL